MSPRSGWCCESSIWDVDGSLLVMLWVCYWRCCRYLVGNDGDRGGEFADLEYFWNVFLYSVFCGVFRSVKLCEIRHMFICNYEIMINFAFQFHNYSIIH